MQSNQTYIVRGAILNPINDIQTDFYQDGALVISDEKVVEIKNFTELSAEQKEFPVKHFSNQLILPGFFDMHFHWVQDDVRLMPKDSLLKWLENYTWPYEQKFSDIEYTKQKVCEFTKSLLQMGTLGGACYGSIHEHTVTLALEHFIGDYILGNVLMTMNSPEYLTQTADAAIKSVQTLSSKYTNQYAFTPRFAITTDPETMSFGQKIALENNSFAQTHLSETENENEFVLSIYRDLEGFKDVKSYTEIYERCGMLHDKSIMGHGIHLSDDDLSMLQKTNTAIAHCPTSNAPIHDQGLGSGLFDFRRVEKAGVFWALGSDIGGGPFLSMFDVMGSFVAQNRRKNISEATYTKALYRSTLAGAEFLNIASTNGNLSANKFANFIVLNSAIKAAESAENSLANAIENTSRDSFHKIVDRTFFKGTEVYKSTT